jgi:hypothetical protein
MAPYLFSLPAYTDAQSVALFESALASLLEKDMLDKLMRRLVSIEESSDYGKIFEESMRTFASETQTDVRRIYLLVRFVLSGSTVGGSFGAMVRLLGYAAVQDRLKHFEQRFSSSRNSQ